MATRRIGIKDIASEAGVSVSAVSQVLRGSSKFSDETRELIESTAARLGYRPNPMARGLVGAKTRTIGIVARDLEGFGTTLGARVMDVVLREEGYTSLIVVSHGEEELELRAIDDLLARGVDGLILSDDSPRPQVFERVRRLVADRFPIVVRGRSARVTGADCVYGRDGNNAQAVFRHLIGLGHRRIALVHHRRSGDFEQAYRECMDEAGIAVDDDLMIHHEIGLPTAALGERLMSLPEPPTAIALCWDSVAASLMAELDGNGSRVPDDVSIVGFGGAWYTPLLRRSLTTIKHDWETAGRDCAELLSRRIADPEMERETRTFESELVIGDSTGPAPAPARMSK